MPSSEQYAKVLTESNGEGCLHRLLIIDQQRQLQWLLCRIGVRFTLLVDLKSLLFSLFPARLNVACEAQRRTACLLAGFVGTQNKTWGSTRALGRKSGQARRSFIETRYISNKVPVCITTITTLPNLWRVTCLIGKFIEIT